MILPEKSNTALICAMKVEAAAIRAALGKEAQPGLQLVRAGIGPLAAACAMKELMTRDEPPELIISTGFCGGLSDELKVGDVVISTEFINGENGKILISNRGAEWLEKIAGALQKAGLRCHQGRVACTNLVVFKADEKRALAQRCSAIAVDMESCAIAASVDLNKTGVIVIRTVSDRAADSLPREIEEFLNAQGNPRIGKITTFVLKNPKNFARLMQLKKNSDQAAKALTVAWKALLSDS